MKKVTVQPKATLVAQVQAGTSVAAVLDDAGVLYLPIMDLNSIIVSDSKAPTTAAPKSAPTVASPKAESPKAASPKAKVEAATTVADVLTKFDDGDLDEEEALAELIKVSKQPKDFVATVFSKFVEDPALEISDIAKEIEVGPIVEKEAPKKKEAKKEEVAVSEENEGDLKPGDEVAIEDLQVDDKVDVYWEEYKDTYTGKVTKVAKGKFYVTYEDGETEVLDPKEHTKITFLG